MRKNLKPPRMSIFSIQNCPPRSFLWNFVTFFEFLETILFLLQCNLNFFDKFTCLWICILNFRSVRLRFRYNILKNILLQSRWICNDNIFKEQLIQNDVETCQNFNFQLKRWQPTETVKFALFWFWDENVEKD